MYNKEVQCKRLFFFIEREKKKMYENICLITAFVRLFQGSYKDLL